MAEARQETEESTRREAIDLTECPECGSKNVVRDSELSELVCRTCGYVIVDRIVDRGPEWREFNL